MGPGGFPEAFPGPRSLELGIRILDEDGGIRPDVISIVDLIAEYEQSWRQATSHQVSRWRFWRWRVREEYGECSLLTPLNQCPPCPSQISVGLWSAAR